MDKLKLHSLDFTDENIKKLAELFPDCVTEDKDDKGNIKKSIDFDQLRQELSKNIVEGPRERYSLNWPGKREALLTANAPIAKTLRPCRAESVDFDTTQNLFIEGDNLDVLKLMQETYLSKIKVIYIDPPYNTGNDFVYEDDFAETSEEFLKKSNQKDEEGNRLVANTESNGRFHSDWLSMMYPRLKLAKNLLKEDGVIFISIGVEEIANLRKIMDEIFGESNFIEIFSWVKTSTPPGLSTKSRKTNEYILCYERNKSSLKYNGEPLEGGDQPLLNTGNTPRKLILPKDKVYFSFLKKGELLPGTPERVELLNKVEIVNGYATTNIELYGEFKWTQAFLEEELKKGTSFIIKSDKLSIRFIRKNEEGYKRPTNFIKNKYTTPLIEKKIAGVGTNETASSEVAGLMGAEVFSYPKPVSLVKFLINFIVSENDIVLDFFAGSGTTTEAAYRWTVDKKKNIHNILIQLPEDLEESLNSCVDNNVKKIIKNGIEFCKNNKLPLVLSELTKERIRRAGKKIKEENATTATDLDIGFRVFKVDSSNMQDVYYNPDAYSQDTLFKMTDNIKSDRTEEDLLFQVLLDWGVDLALPVLKEKIAGNDVFFVSDNALAACFAREDEITEDFCKELAKREPLRVVFRDAGFKDDSVKINVEQIFKLASPHTEIKTI